MKIRANAKINLSLDITGKRQDGYHIISSVMQAVSLSDEVEINKSVVKGLTLSCSRDDLPVDKRNTAYRAAAAMLKYAGIDDIGVDIYIKKVIPSEAGLGGGSADAAAVLQGMKELFEIDINEMRLMEIAAGIGADVPFCLKGGTGLCSGIGEIVTPIMHMPKCYIVICKPPVGVSTKAAYDAVDTYMNDNIIMTPIMEDALWKNDLRLIASALSNRFDDILHIADVQIIKSIFMENNAMGTSMSGSGSSVFALFDELKDAEKAGDAVRNCGETFICEPV